MATIIKFLKRPHLSILILLTFLSHYPQCQSENIYYKDGRAINVRIIYRDKDTLWIKQSVGSTGIDINTISRIENNDGSISKYDVAFLTKQIQEFIKQKKYAEAEKLCGTLLETSPNNVEIRYLRGMLSQKAGDTEMAIEDYEYLINHDDADERIFNNLGAIYAGQKRYKTAEELFYKALGYNQNRAEIRNNLSELFMEAKEYAKAIEEYNKLITLEPDNESALYNLGIAYKNTGDFTKAKELWERVLALKPEDADAKNALEYLSKQTQ
ncbi:MAG: tetratricopeptide repeat protein [Candidatus Omnitrophica bacterium]|nr:tetratricopeptide repeat protein [Candidatus Omnitrophota bacterium]